jgi:hypothetical protein
MDAAREGRLAGQAQVLDLVPGRAVGRIGAELVARTFEIRVVRRIGEVCRRVEAIDLHARLRNEARTALRPLLERRLEPIRFPSVLVFTPPVVSHGAILGAGPMRPQAAGGTGHHSAARGVHLAAACLP